jgi:hypothetical protein
MKLMSRKNIVGEDHTISFGVDHATGAFVQLWENPWGEQDGAFILIDSNGIKVNDDDGTKVTGRVAAYLERVEERFKTFQKSKPGERPNITEDVVIGLSQVAGGFPDISAEVYKIFGEDA